MDTIEPSILSGGRNWLKQTNNRDNLLVCLDLLHQIRPVISVQYNQKCSEEYPYYKQLKYHFQNRFFLTPLLQYLRYHTLSYSVLIILSSSRGAPLLFPNLLLTCYSFLGIIFLSIEVNNWGR